MAGDDTVLDSPPRAAPGLVVGVGASAGGLAALEALFAALPPERPSGLSFVVVQHLAPDHKSILAELVQRRTAWPVVEVGAESVVEPDHIYIVPPNRDLTLVDRRLILATPTAPRGQHLPIDSFFVSLSALGPRAVAIILSGSGRDGSAGAVAVKEAGGTVIVQNPASAAFDEMPRQALATGVADRVLAPGEMPIALAAMAARSDGDAVPEPAALGALERASVGQILAVLRSRTGHDFAEYKQNTILRRIERRMAQLRIATGGEYLGRLVDDPSEADHLFRDLLIGVTSFFRDPDAFEALRARAITQLFTDRPAGALVRVWVPGCSTGEEAYALAILLHELSIQLGGTVGVQLFATDVDRRAIERARAGVYPASVAADLGAERLERWFVLEPDGASYRVGRAIRDLCVFSEHDVTRDPPFSKLDVVSCRNLFIYFDARLQKRLLALFHYALEPGGLLLLGTSETVGDAGELFATVDQQHKLFQRNVLAPRGVGAPVALARQPRPRPPAAVTPAATVVGTLREAAERGLLDEFGAAGILVDERGDILYLHGRSGLYLEPSPGEASMNVLRMARAGLRADLAIALRQSAASGEPARVAGLRVKTNGDFTPVRLAVRPVAVTGATGPEPTLFLVVLQADTSAPAAVTEQPREGPAPEGEELARLRAKLSLHDEHMLAFNAELGHFNEALKSTNEELQSTNEELQSTVEELETSKEELQSVNEELTTVNHELNAKVSDLSRVNNDMSNLLAATGIGMIFVDHQLRIQRFTPTITAVMHLIPSDVGRPLAHVVSNLVDYQSLVGDVQAVLDSLVPREVDVRSTSGVWYSLRIRPYRTLDNVIEGAVIAFVDIDDLRARTNTPADATGSANDRPIRD